VLSFYYWAVRETQNNPFLVEMLTNDHNFLQYYLFCFHFLVFQVGILIPWNAFVSAKPYFTARLCQASGQDIVNFEQWFGLIWNTSSVFSLGLLIFGQCEFMCTRM
jgi:hypothetical protein